MRDRKNRQTEIDETRAKETKVKCFPRKGINSSETQTHKQRRNTQVIGEGTKVVLRSHISLFVSNKERKKEIR